MIRCPNFDASDIFPFSGSTTRRPASLHGVCRRVGIPPLHRYYQDATNSCRPSCRASLPSLGSTAVRLVFAPMGPRRKARGPGVLLFGPTPWARSPGRRQDLPSSWGTPIACSLMFLDSGRTAVPDHGKIAARPPRSQQRRLLHWSFRSSIAWLPGWLSTLRRMGYPITTQDSLPGGGQPLLGGLAYPQGPNERFQIRYIIIPLSQASLGATI